MARKTEGYKLTPLELEVQLNKIPYRLNKQLFDFVVETSKYAKKTFINSFKHKRFYSANGTKWQQLSDFTIKKRTRKNTWPGRGILEDSGDLRQSIKVDYKEFKGGINRYSSHVFTDPNVFKSANNPNRPLCYAGLHNNPSLSDTYGSGFGGKKPKKIVQRQFMGFSTYIDKFMEANIDRYLFDGVFGAPGMYSAASE